MKTNIFFKKSFTIIMAFAMLFSLFGTSNTTVTANAADLPVKMYYCDRVATVKYTQDNWATCQEAALSYSSDYINNSNYENWTVTLNLNENKMDSFHYYVTYQVNGHTYIDNNFGANYNTSHYLPLGS